MLFDFNGMIRPEHLDRVMRPLFHLLMNERIEHVSSLSVSFLGWRRDGRCQIVDSEGFITSLRIDPEATAARSNECMYVLPDGITIRNRPDDLEWSLFNVSTRRDD